MTENSVRIIWNKIESILEDSLAELNLREGASESDIAKWHTTLGATIPDDVCESYRLHDGQKLGSDTLFEEWNLLSIDDSIRIWTNLNEVHSGDTHVLWKRGWVPIATNGLGDLHIVDLAERPGQVFVLRHEKNGLLSIAGTFSEWLGQVLEKINQEHIKFPSNDLGVIPSMEALMRLLGLPLSDAKVQQTLASSSVDKEIDGNEITLNGRGFAIVSVGGIITKIELYFSPSSVQERYSGDLIGKVQGSDARSEIRAKLGNPTLSDNNGANQSKLGWDVYMVAGVRVQMVFKPNHPGIGWIAITKEMK